VQPVIGFSMTVASLYFHVFLLAGSFFGLNLFASFMCDTFYSLQGTAQLEEVQFCKIAKYELATGSKLANIAYEQVHVTRV